MANFIFARDFYEYTIDSFSSENINSPAENIFRPAKQRKYWKTTDVTDQYIILDLGSAQEVSAVALLNVNYNTFNIQGSTTTSFASPDTDSGTLNTVYDPMRGRYYSITMPQDYSPAFNYRYLRLFIPEQSTTDGLDVFRTGGVIVKTGEVTTIMNPDWGLSIRISRASDKNQLRSGDVEVRNIGERKATISLSMTRDMRVESEMDEIGDLVFTIDETEPVLICDNGDFLHKSDTPYIYCACRDGDATMTYERYPISKTSAVFMEKI